MPDEGVRRPRIPPELAERIDKTRGDVPFERWVRRALEKALGQPGQTVAPHVVAETVEQPAPPRVPTPRPEGSPRSKPFVCPVASCQWPGADKQNEEQCPIHRRNLIARRS